MDHKSVKSKGILICWILSTFFCCTETADLRLTQGLRQKHLKWNTLTDISPDIQQSYKGVLKTIFDTVKNSDKATFHEIMNTQKNQERLMFSEVSFACLNDTEMVIEGLSTHQLYAIKFLDADAKPPSGILQGQMMWTGNYHECINIESPLNIHTGHIFKGEYFTANVNGRSIQSFAPQGVFVGICLPDSCSKEDAQSLMNIAFSWTNQTVVAATFSTNRPPIDGSSKAAIAICCIIFTVILFGTSIDYFQQWNESRKNTKMQETQKYGYQDIETTDSYSIMNGEVNERSGLLADSAATLNSKGDRYTNKLSRIGTCLKTFSFFANTKKLMNTSTATGPLACLNGLRVISMWWVIQGHTYSFAELVMKDILYAEKTLFHRFSFQPIANGTYSVDTFFFLSGLLVAYLALKEISTKGKLNWVYYFLHRYWRLTPVYAFSIMCFTTVFTLMLSGPLVFLALDPKGPLYTAWQECRTYWWSNLLYINNFYPNYGATLNCFGWAWYLANDMQFYIFLSPLVIILLRKNKKVGIAFCMLLIAACIGTRAFLAHYYGINQNEVVSKHKDVPWSKTGPLYTKPYSRWSVYIVGMLTGYILQVTKCRIRLNTCHTMTGWAVSIAMGVSVIYGLYHSFETGHDMSETGAIFYLSCARTAWSLSLAWLVIACATGNGGWVNTILSWKFWAPMGRLTYAAYLVHPMVLVAFYLTMVQPIPFTDLNFVYLFIANVVLSYGVAYVVSMAVEAPMLQLEKLLLNRS